MQNQKLWEKIITCSRIALNQQALTPIKTNYQILEDKKIPFIVRMISQLEKKEEEKKIRAAANNDINPFLPYDPALYVTDLNQNHICLLNKFKVIDHHILIVTKKFEEQTNLLNLRDFAALSICLKSFSGLGFYNSGTIAGASQSHKHLQVIPLPIIPEIKTTSLDRLIEQQIDFFQSSSLAEYPFQHQIIRLKANQQLSINAFANLLAESYQQLCQILNISSDYNENIKPYNLLITNNWMMIILRKQEKYRTISVNAMGFAGSLFVKNKEQLELIEKDGPIHILSKVAVEK
ncbi:MAG: phosphorylase [Spirochaetes bacterium]|nr:phosphorylase [Spirochaetota bacterium]